MCLENIESVLLKSLNAFKVFALYRGQLYSAFSGAYHCGFEENYDDLPPYKLNEEIKCLNHTNLRGFYSFVDKKSAEECIIDSSYANYDDLYWNWREQRDKLLIFPVTISDNIYRGFLRSSNQVWRNNKNVGYVAYAGYASQKITVHVTTQDIKHYKLIV